MNFRVKILAFTDGVPALGGNQSVAVGGVTGGPKTCEFIRRITGGYVVGWQGKTFVVPDARVSYAEVEIEPDEQPKGKR